jgi:predicted transposase/invertase (TIGR01784 family)
LDNELDAPRIDRITAEMARQDEAVPIKAYMDVITRANSAILEEAYNMSNSTVTLEEVLERTGITARAEARGEVKGKEEAKLEVAKKLLNKGLPVEDIAEVTGLGLGAITELASNR